MKIDFTQSLVGYDNNILMVAKDEPARLGALAIQALMSPPLNEERRPVSLSGGEILRRDALARLIYAADGPIELSVEDAALIKSLLPKVILAPMYVAPALRLLDGSS